MFTKLASILIITSLLILTGCTKQVPKELQTNNQKMPLNQQEMPNDSIHRNLQQNQNQPTVSNSDDDPKADELTKAADGADAKYMKSKSEGDKKIAIEKQMEAANYLMFQADLTPKKKYRPALKRYRRVLELDPANQEAAANKKQIEDIYESMGMPIPQ